MGVQCFGTTLKNYMCHISNRLAKIVLSSLLLFLTLSSFSPQPATAQTQWGNEFSQIMPSKVKQRRLVTYIKEKDSIKKAWQAMVGILDVVVFIGLIVLALASIFHIKYDQYQIKQALPGLIAGVILANLSFSICLFFIDLTQHVTDLFIGSPASFIQNMVDLYSWLWYLAGAGVAGAGIFALATGGLGIGIVLLALLLALVPMLLLFAVGLILWARALVITALTIFSPLAFFLYFFKIEIPVLTPLAQKWMSWFAKWLAAGPLIFALFWVGFTLNNAARGKVVSNQSTGLQQSSSGETPSSQNPNSPPQTASLQDKARNLCQQKKEEFSRKGWQQKWEEGPCLSQNLDNSGYAVDIAHQPRKTVDNNPANQCAAPEKFIELDTNCNVIRIYP